MAVIATVLVLSVTGAGTGGIPDSAAEDAAADVAYVEAVTGHVIASGQGTPSLLEALDPISDRMRLDLQANSELRICHYRTHKLVTLKGPLRASVSDSGVTAEKGSAVDGSGPTCAVPVVSTLQGGFMSRSVALSSVTVPLRPSIKVVNRGAQAIRKVALWDDMHRTNLATFERNVARPELADRGSYILAVELDDGSEVKMMLRANAATESSPLIVTIR